MRQQNNLPQCRSCVFLQVSTFSMVHKIEFEDVNAE